jgi:ankyrin repeat protein
MLTPIEMQRTLPMTLHGGAKSTTTEVWAMLSAANAGDVERVRELIAQRPELATCQYNYTPPLHFAVREGHLELVRLLVDRGAYDPGYKSYPFGETLVTIARDRGYEEIVALLESARERGLAHKWVDTGEIDYQQDEEQLRFDRALHDGKRKDVERLLAERPKLAQNELSSWAEGVLMMPAGRRNRALLEVLLLHGARVPIMSKWARFYYFKHDDVAALLMERGMSAHHRTWHGVTLLHDMAQNGDLAKARLLIDHGAEIDTIEDEYRSTPLGLAARWGRRPLVDLLLSHGAKPNAAGAPWSTPLAWARAKGHVEIERMLVAAGAV